ncbi:MAG: response regulator [Myxococcales bacterium]
MTSRPAALIVEDQPFVGMVASDILRESGFETFHAYDAKDAAQVLDDHPEIEVMITEAQLPGDEDGIELCRRMSRQRPDLQLVVASGEDLQSTDVPQGARVLRKPFASGELRTLVAAKSLLADA